MKDKNITKRTPKRVVNRAYYDRDCATYGKCPNCGSTVIDAIWGTNNKCPKCKQPLIW